MTNISHESPVDIKSIFSFRENRRYHLLWYLNHNVWCSMITISRSECSAPEDFLMPLVPPKGIKSKRNKLWHFVSWAEITAFWGYLLCVGWQWIYFLKMTIILQLYKKRWLLGWLKSFNFDSVKWIALDRTFQIQITTGMHCINLLFCGHNR